MEQLATVNLNHLVALHALLEERSVSRAAQRVGVTQSAMSHTLRQLRGLFDDPLLVRSGRAMVPTPRAEALLPTLHTALSSLDTLVGHQGRFEPERSTAQFTLATQDGVVAALSPVFFRRFREQAPNASLSIVRPPADLSAALADGRVDVATAPPIDIPAGLASTPVNDVETTWAVLCCASHPIQQMSIEAFCEHPHAMMSLSGRGPSFVDHILGSMGHKRQIGVRVPFLLAMPYILPNTDLLAVVVGPAADHFTERWPLKRFDVPFPMPSPPAVLLWHERYRADPAHQWFRALVRASFEDGAPQL